MLSFNFLDHDKSCVILVSMDTYIVCVYVFLHTVTSVTVLLSSNHAIFRMRKDVYTHLITLGKFGLRLQDIVNVINIDHFSNI